MLWGTSREKVDFVLNQVRDVSLVWYTQWNENKSVESGPIEWKEFEEAFPRNYFSRERMEVKVEEFINIKYGNTSIVE